MIHGSMQDAQLVRSESIATAYQHSGVDIDGVLSHTDDVVFRADSCGHVQIQPLTLSKTSTDNVSATRNSTLKTDPNDDPTRVSSTDHNRTQQ